MKSSSDIWFIAFLMLKGHKIADYTVVSKGKVRCSVNLTDDEWQQLKLEFNNSEYIKFKSLVEQVKDLGY